MTGDQYYISVGDPWNFESGDGQNIIRGTIVGISGEEYLVFKSNHPVTFGDCAGTVLVLTHRHTGHRFSDLDKEHAVITVNGSLLLKPYEPGSSKAELLDNARFVLAGGIHKSKERAGNRCLNELKHTMRSI